MHTGKPVFAQRRIGIARKLYINELFGVDLTNTAYAPDSTAIDLSLSLFPWAPFRSTKAAVKMHTLLDLPGNILSFIPISDGKLHDVNILDQLVPEAGAGYVMDRGYIDFQRVYGKHQTGSFFVTRAKHNMDAQRRYSHPTDRSTGVIFDQTLMLQGYQSAEDYPETFRGIRCKDRGNRQTAAVHHQQHSAARTEHLLFVQGQMAGGVLLSVDQNAFAREGILWNLGKRREVASRDRRVGLRARRHHQEASQSVSQPTRSAADFEPQPIRETLLDIALSRIPARSEMDQNGNQLMLFRKTLGKI